MKKALLGNWRKTERVAPLALVALLLTSALVGWAQQPGDPNGLPANPSNGSEENSGDSPNHAVARVSIINGNVSVRRGDSGEAVAAAVNAPLSATDRIQTAEGSRAEVQFDALNMVRLAPLSEVRIGELEYHKYQVQIATGTVMFRVMRDGAGEVEISTPSVSVRPLKRGSYRVTVKPDGTSEITVRSGEAEIFSPKGTEKLGSGKTMEARGTAADPEFQVVAGMAQDNWDKWNEQRDHDLERLGSSRYVNPDINGTEELDANGQWANDPGYGQVWVPRVGPDWAPYRVGRWVWVDYYGWSWVSGDPWGWAPYHYGRWYWGSLGWAWWPGPIIGPCYWRPALVGFFGWGGGFGVSVGFGFGFGHIGWVPLAPFERFHPWYGAGFYGHGFNNVNIVHNTNITNIYRNARVTNGTTSVVSNNFGHGGINTGNYVHAGAGDLARAGAVHGAMPVTPSRESTHFSDRAAPTSGMPRTNENSHFFSSRPGSSSASTQRMSFDQQRQAMNQSAQRSQTALGNGAAGNGAANSGTSMNRGANPGASPMNSAPRTSGSTPNNSNGGSSNEGWQRFNPSTSSANNSGAGARPGMSTPQSQPQSQARPATPSGAGQSNGSGGWQRFNGNNSGATGSNPANGGRSPQSYSSPSRGTYSAPSAPQSRGNYSAPQSRSYSGGGQQPVRVNPPIVQNRGGGAPSGSASAPSHSQSHGGFGGAHSGGGGSGGGGSRSSGGGGSHGGGRR